MVACLDRDGKQKALSHSPSLSQLLGDIRDLTTLLAIECGAWSPKYVFKKIEKIVFKRIRSH